MYSGAPSAPGRRLPKPTPLRHKNATRSQGCGEARAGSSGYMSDTFALTRELAAAAAPCFDTADRLAVYTEMNLDEPRCRTRRDRRHHLRGASRGSPDTGRTARPAPGMARREPRR